MNSIHIQNHKPAEGHHHPPDPLLRLNVCIDYVYMEGANRP